MFIVDLYMKRNEYIIYLYIMKYYDLVFEVGIDNDTFHESYIQSSLVRVSVKAPCAVFGYSLLHVE